MTRTTAQDNDERVTNTQSTSLEVAEEENIDQSEKETSKAIQEYFPSEIESAARIYRRSKSYSAQFQWRNGRDRFKVSIPDDLVLERWELTKNFVPVVHGDANVRGRGPSRGSKGTVQIEVDWWVHPFNTVRYILSVYAARQPRTVIIDFLSRGWDERARQMISQKIPFHIRVTGQIALDMWKALSPYLGISFTSVFESQGIEAQKMEIPQMEMDLIRGLELKFREQGDGATEISGIEVDPGTAIAITAIVVGGLTLISATMAAVLMFGIANGCSPKARLEGRPGTDSFALIYDFPCNRG